MKQLFAFILALLCWTATSSAQDQPFKGDFANEKTGFQIHIDLYEESVEVPGLAFMGLMNGYLDGKTNNDVYGVWTLIKFEVNKKKAKLRFINDIGSDTQEVILTLVDEDTLEYSTTGGNSIKRVQGNKLVKTASSMTLTRVK